MRTEKVMFELILDVARKDKRVRAVCMNGSRTNPNAPKDLFQDFDIVYIVDDLSSFLATPDWIDVYGRRIIMQTPETMELLPPAGNNRFVYLMQFEDGNRIDLTLLSREKLDTYLDEDRLTVVLLDKDKLISELPPPTDENYWVKLPTRKLFSDCCNEFWWVSLYVAKGLWRKEILYAKEHLDCVLRPMLNHMLAWKVGLDNRFQVSVGKCNKYLEKYLGRSEWEKLLATFSSGTYEKTWDALFNMVDLFSETAKYVSERMSFDYLIDEELKVKAFLVRISDLPEDARTFF